MIDFRLRLISRLIPVIALLIIVRLFYWQIFRGPQLAAEAKRQHLDVVRLSARRGEIFDTNGNVLSGTKNLYHLYAYKPLFKDDNASVASHLALVLTPEIAATDPAQIKQTESEILERLNLKANWISLKHYLTREQKDTIESYQIAGLNFEDEFVRFYPEASMSAQILGFVGQDQNGQEKGYFGLEGFFDRELQGKEGLQRVEKDASGRPILIGKYLQVKNVEGRSFVTTIDRKIQYLAEQVLASGLERYQATSAAVIVMESRTGKIRAMASLPSYTPGEFYQADSDYFSNPSVANLYEPGSTFKVLVMAAALNEGLVDPESICDVCSQPLNISGYTIKTWNDQYHPNANMSEIIKYSDNVGMVFVAQKLGSEKFLNYLDQFGFGKKTGIELEEETSGWLKPKKEFREIDLATTAFGQGIAVTPIQLITAVNTIANNGYLIKPTLIEKILDAEKEIIPPPSPTQKILSPETVNKITQMMVEAVIYGEAKWAAPKNIKIAGKTGTAQIPIGGKYDKEKTIASFVGFFPADNPQYTILVTLKEPQSSPWGSETAAPLWFNLARKLILF